MNSGNSAPAPLKNTPVDHLRDAVMIANAIEHQVMEEGLFASGPKGVEAAQSLLADVRQLRDRIRKGLEGFEEPRIVVGAGDRL